MYRKILNKEDLLYLLYITTFLVFFWILANNWLNGGYIIAGHDSGLALNTSEFLKTRFYSWDPRVNFGQDNSSLFGSILLHFFDYGLAAISGQQAAGNPLAVFFWLGVLFISAFVFANSFKQIFGKYFIFIFPPLITINFYIFQSMFILERAKYELVSVLLLFMVIVFKLHDRKFKILTAAILAALVFFVFNGGGWIGLPLFGGVLIFTLVFLVLTIIEGIIKLKFEELLRLIKFLTLTSVFFLLLNSYSALPYFVTFKDADFSSLGDPNLKQANIDWIGSLSQGASFLNLFRLQGVPDWFNSQNIINTGHQFAQTYFEKVPLVIASFIFPILALIGFKLAKNRLQKKMLSYFWIFTLVGMFFSAGTHPPLGFLYEFIYKYVPGFVIFRSPYYKFGSLLFVGFSVLLAFATSALISNLTSNIKKRQLKNLVVFFLVALIVGGWLVFYFKLYSVNIFSWQKGFTTRVKVPSYVEEFNSYLSINEIKERILLLPPLDDNWKNDGYTWGYWSLSMLPYSLSSDNFLANGFGLNKEEESWVNKLYTDFSDRNEKNFLDTANRLGVGYILFRKDVSSFRHDSRFVSQDDYEKLLNQRESIRKIAEFGNWSFFKIMNVNIKSVSSINKVVTIPEQDVFLSRELLTNERMVILKDELVKSPNIEQFISQKANSLDCDTCILEKYEVSNQLPKVTILPGSILYWFKEYRENQEISKAKDDASRMNSYLAFTLRRTGEFFKMVTYGIEERYLKSNLDSINLYLDQVYEIISKISNPNEDYVTALRVRAALDPVENNLKLYIPDRSFLVRGEGFRSTVLDTMMRIYKIKSYYRPLLKDVNTLRFEKRYTVDTLVGNESLFLKKSSLPKDGMNMPIYPSEINYQQGEKTTKIDYDKGFGEWIEIKLSESEKKGGFINLMFGNLPNLYFAEGYNLQVTPTGEKACYLSKIQNFDPAKIYEVKVNTDKKDQVLKLFFKDEKSNESFNFLVGRPEVNVFPLLSYEPFRYLFRPDNFFKNPTIYICSDNKEQPIFNKVEVFELYSPQMVVIKKETLNLFQNPEIEVKQENPTKYLVNISNAKDPFILSLNQKYNSLWRIYENKNFFAKLKDTFQKNNNSNHILLDGYANGWIINQKGDYALTIEYAPQLLFSLGYKITMVSVFLSMFYLILIFIRGILKRS